MDKEKVNAALVSALQLLKNEVNTIELEELKMEYLCVIENLENALNELDKDE